MYNPLLPDLSKLKNEDLELKISELMKKYLIASRAGQGNVCQQILVVIDSYKEEQSKRMAAASAKSMKQSGNLEDYINVDR